MSIPRVYKESMDHRIQMKVLSFRDHGRSQRGRHQQPSQALWAQGPGAGARQDARAEGGCEAGGAAPGGTRTRHVGHIVAGHHICRRMRAQSGGAGEEAPAPDFLTPPSGA